MSRVIPVSTARGRAVESVRGHNCHRERARHCAAAKPPRQTAAGFTSRPLGDPGVRGVVSREPGSATRARRHKRKGSRRLPRAVGATGRQLGRTGGHSARSRGGVAATGQGAGGAGTSRGAAARGHYRPHRGRSAWFERRVAFCRHCGKSSISRLQSERSAFCRHCRTTSGKRPEFAGFWHHHERASLSRTTASSGQRGDGVASSRARRFHRLEFAARSAAHGP